MAWWKLASADVDEGSLCLSRGVGAGGAGPMVQAPPPIPDAIPAGHLAKES